MTRDEFERYLEFNYSFSEGENRFITSILDYAARFSVNDQYQILSELLDRTTIPDRILRKVEL